MNCQKYKPTYILIAINVAAYIYTSIAGGNAVSTSFPMEVMYGQVNGLVLQGAWWQLITSMFIHASIAHIAGNMLFLFIFGLGVKKCFHFQSF